MFANAAKGISALQLSRDLDIQYKTAWVLLHKIRESLMDYDNSQPFQGVVEMDGVYVNGYIRPRNRLEKRIDRKKVYKPNKRVVISLRQRSEFGIGANHTRTFILRSENPIELSRIAYRFIVRGSEVIPMRISDI
ncbi:transposase [Campylobacter devanensis]|uniref:transposase n=1 Tax=Campylobacter devanensis TaxID=3161138 RepID=UPI001EF13E65|nr:MULTISPECIES: transposase [unclassified Campylobacter]